jgi:hypothetical protein
MNPEERSLLEKTYQLVEENNRLLSSMRRMSRINLGMRITYWVIIIGLSLGALYFIQPYFDFLKNLGESSALNTNGVNNSGESSLELLQDLLK